MAELLSPDIDWVYFVELHPLDTVSETPLNIYLATRDAFFSGTDPDAPLREYNGVVDVALSLSRGITVEGAAISPNAQASYGGIVVKVDDELAADAVAGLLKWKTCAWDGYPFRVLRGVAPADEGAWVYADLEVIATGVTAGGITWGATQVTIPIGGFPERLRKDFATAVYAGTGGFEGGEDLKGKVKRRAIGKNLHVSPVLIDPAEEWWDVAPIDGFHSDVKVYQGGIEYAYSGGPGVAPDPGEVYVDMANGRIRTMGMPSYPLTVSFVSGFADGAVTIADTVQGVIEEIGFESAEIDAATFTALNAACDAPVGFYVENSTMSEQIVNALLASAGAFHTDAAGKFQVFQFAPPDAANEDAADFLFTDEDIARGGLTFRPEAVPPYRLDFDFAHCATSFGPDQVVEEAEDAERLFVLSRWRTEPYTNATTQAHHKHSQPRRVESRMTERADALAEVNRQGPMFTKRCEILDAQICTAPFGLTVHTQVWVRSAFNRVNAAYRVINVADLSKSGRVNTALWRPL